MKLLGVISVDFDIINYGSDVLQSSDTGKKMGM
jgi:hypothetical protein